MNVFSFEGRLADAPKFHPAKSQDGSPLAFFRLLRNEYAGKDRDERVISADFVAFDHIANFVKSRLVGDQLIITARFENTRRDVDGQTIYGYRFVVIDISLGAPGQATRKRLSEESNRDPIDGETPQSTTRNAKSSAATKSSPAKQTSGGGFDDGFDDDIPM